MVMLSSIILLTPLSHANAKDTNIILLFGDSIIAGYGLSVNNSLSVKLELLLQQKFPAVRVINGGVSGDTTAGGRNRLDWTLNRRRPDLVIVALGGNDVLRGIPPEVTRDNISAMLDVLKRQNIPTILSAVQAPDSYGRIYQEKLDAAYKELAEIYDVPLYPFLLADVFGNTAMMQADGIHPNAQGTELIAKKLADYITTSDLLTTP